MCNLKALDALHNAGMVGSDATTSLDTFIRRASEFISDAAADLGPFERHHWMTDQFGSDAVRAASILLKGASA